MTLHLLKPLFPEASPSNRVPLLRLALPKPPRHLMIRTFPPLTSLVDHGWTKNKPDGSSGHTTVNRSLGFIPLEFLKGLYYAHNHSPRSNHYSHIRSYICSGSHKSYVMCGSQHIFCPALTAPSFCLFISEKASFAHHLVNELGKARMRKINGNKIIRRCNNYKKSK